MARLTLWHRTSRSAAQDIIQNGFRDSKGDYLTRQKYSGVWVADQPLDANEGAFGETLLRVDFHGDEANIAAYEWVEEGKGYREWLVPAKLLNDLAQVSIEDDEEDEILPPNL